MCFILHKWAPGLERNEFGLDFSGPVGFGNGIRGGSFMVICSDDVRSTIAQLKEKRPVVPVFAQLATTSSAKSFSLLYDFADLFIINLEHEEFFREILDEVLAVRLLNDKYKSILVRIPPEFTLEQLHELMDYSMYSGIDGIVTGNAAFIPEIKRYSGGRLPVIAGSEDSSPAHVASLLEAGAVLVELLPQSLRLGRIAIRQLQKVLK